MIDGGTRALISQAHSLGMSILLVGEDKLRVVGASRSPDVALRIREEKPKVLEAMILRRDMMAALERCHERIEALSGVDLPGEPGALREIEQRIDTAFREYDINALRDALAIYEAKARAMQKGR